MKPVKTSGLAAASFLAAILWCLASGCEQPGGPGKPSEDWGPVEPPGVPQNVALIAGAGAVGVTWDIDTDADSWEVWYGVANPDVLDAAQWSGPVSRGTDQAGAVISGLTAADDRVYVWVKAVNAAGKSGFSERKFAKPAMSLQAALFFDYGRRISSTETAQTGTYTVPLGRGIVLAPVEWRLGSDGYEWEVNGEVQAETGKTFRFTPAAQGAYTVGVKAKKGDGYIEGAAAETWVLCTPPEGAYKRSPTGASGVKALALHDFVQAPGQFIGRYGGSLSPGVTEAQVLAGDQALLESTGGEQIFSLGRFGGYIVYGFDHSVENAEGPDIRINGNAFINWNEPGTVWVSQDDNGDGEANDTWYELRGSLTGTAAAIQRYAVSYLQPAGTNTGGTWIDNLGNTGVYFKHFPPQFSGDLTFVGTKLDIGYTVDHHGYVDTVSTNKFEINDAMQADGSSAALRYVDFVKIQCALLVEAGIFGEISTETGVPFDLSIPNPELLIQGTLVGGGQYNYRFVNNSGYDLTLAIEGQSYEVLRNAERTITLDKAQVYFDYYGGNVTFTKAPGLVTFSM
ncbi:MAG: hypothetical protein LBS57_02325 [Treponema sp.]|nr:hypothetical protein [Treponema sp.]